MALKVRSALFSDPPTMAEAGVPGFDVQNLQGLIALTGTCVVIIRTLNMAVNQAWTDPAIKAQRLVQRNELGGGSTEGFAALIKSKADRWGKLVKSASIKPE